MIWLDHKTDQYEGQGGTSFYADAPTINQSGTRIYSGQRVGNLYYLNQESVPNTEMPRAVAKLVLSTNQSSIATIETWHKGLGH